jgi:hypothetical protein
MVSPVASSVELSGSDELPHPGRKTVANIIIMVTKASFFRPERLVNTLSPFLNYGFFEKITGKMIVQLLITSFLE